MGTRTASPIAPQTVADAELGQAFPKPVCRATSDQELELGPRVLSRIPDACEFILFIFQLYVFL